MASRWSWNIDGLDVDTAAWYQLVQWGIETRPAYTLIMDDKSKSREWQSKIGGVIYRTYDGRDNHYHDHVTPVQAANQLAQDHSDMKDVWHYYRLNEPGGEWHKLQAWLIAFAKEAKLRGFKVTTCGLALGKNWDTPDFIRNGNADALLDYAMANPDTFLLDAHEYVTGTLWSPQIESYPSALFNRDLLLANENIPVKTDTYTGHNGFVNWGLFRVCWLANARAIEKYGKPLDCVLTEGLFDFNSHIIQPPHTYSTLPDGRKVTTESEIRKYGEQQFNTDVRGVLGHRKYLAWVFTGNANPNAITDEQYAEMVMRNFRWAEKAYPANVKGIALFAVNNDWRIPEGHDYTPILPALLPKMKSLALIQSPEPTPEPQPEIEWRAMNIEGYNSVRKLPVDANVRLTPNGTVIGILPAMPTVTRANVSLAPATLQDGYEWIEVILHPDTDNAIRGWIANHVFRVATTPVFDFGGLRRELLEWHAVLADLQTHIEEQLDNLPVA